MEFPRPENIEFCTDDTIRLMLADVDSLAERSGVRYERVLIGRSRAGREMWGLDIGGGGTGEAGEDDGGCGRTVSITAGAHADEPVGPITAFALARFLLGTEAGNSLASTHRFRICPQVNPDGAEANKAWFADPPDAVTYFTNAIREAPGDDIEFGYPDPRPGAKIGALRLENQAVADFLSGVGPYAFHASLHSMGIAEGAWFLIGGSWAERSSPLRDRLKVLACEIAPYPHDIDRQGQKGFTRIERGFATTPTSTAMREFFTARGEDSTAEKFHLSSMEFVQGLGGDPLVMVSELPIFRIGMDYKWTDPPGSDTPFLRLRSELAEARLENDPRQALEKLIVKYALKAVPPATQVRVQGQMIVEALEFLGGQERP